MSVLIKGMEMPTTCEECDFCHWSNLHQTGICDRYGDEPVCPDHGTDYRKTRARFCPLIELPEKHGRLVDADALIDGYRHMGYDPNEHPEESYMEGWCKGFNSAVDHCMGHVIHTPTIIEAEGDEE